MKRLILLVFVCCFLLTGCKEDVAPEECIEQTNEFLAYFDLPVYVFRVKLKIESEIKLEPGGHE